ncbi:glycosyltransferase [Clostridium perfringens]|uniref:glycosyltransferase n=1 Tax=Clostridium perfringens TaxID=1502 RepID=UPI003AF50FD5
MNILIIPAFLFTKSDITLGSFFFEQAKALKKQGHNVFILYCDTFSIKYSKDYLCYKEESYEVRDGIHIFRKKCLAPFKHGSGLYGNSERFKNAIIDLYNKNLKDVNIDIIHAHGCIWAGYAAFKLSLLIKRPYIITEHLTVYQLNPQKITGNIEKKVKEAFVNADKVICVSDGLKKIISKYSKKILVLGNVIDCDLFNYDKNKKRNISFTFLSICYMKNLDQIKKKGLDILINAFSEVSKEYKDIKLLIGGGGESISIVSEWIKEKNMEEKIVLLGPLSRKKVAREMQNCDCFILPSRYETFGVVYIEAMASGKPVIGTRTGGPDNFVNKENGILVDVEDTEMLIKSMKYMIKNIKSYDNSKIRDYVVNRFSLDIIGKKLSDIYISVLNDRKEK